MVIKANGMDEIAWGRNINIETRIKPDKCQHLVASRRWNSRGAGLSRVLRGKTGHCDTKEECFQMQENRWGLKHIAVWLAL